MKVIFICLLVFAVVACDPAEKARPFPKDKFDAIEKIVGNNNWQVVNGQDTFCAYYSRTGDVHMNVYLYEMKQGDSTGTSIKEIWTTPDNLVFWNWGKNKQLLLTSVNDTSIKWVNTKTEDAYIIKKVDTSHLLWIPAGETGMVMKKTLPLATYLVRSHYDHIHGTSLVDSPLVQSSEARAK